jgi:hypothetical protein
MEIAREERLGKIGVIMCSCSLILSAACIDEPRIKNMIPRSIGITKR